MPWVWPCWQYSCHQIHAWADSRTLVRTLCCIEISASSVGFAFMLKLHFVDFIKFLLWVVFVDCIGVGIAIATTLWWVRQSLWVRRSLSDCDQYQLSIVVWTHLTLSSVKMSSHHLRFDKSYCSWLIERASGPSGTCAKEVLFWQTMQLSSVKVTKLSNDWYLTVTCLTVLWHGPCGTVDSAAWLCLTVCVAGGRSVLICKPPTSVAHVSVSSIDSHGSIQLQRGISMILELATLTVECVQSSNLVLTFLVGHGCSESFLHWMGSLYCKSTHAAWHSPTSVDVWWSRHYTNDARLQMEHSNMLSRGWHVITRARETTYLNVPRASVLHLFCRMTNYEQVGLQNPGAVCMTRS